MSPRKPRRAKKGKRRNSGNKSVRKQNICAAIGGMPGAPAFFGEEKAGAISFSSLPARVNEIDFHMRASTPAWLITRGNKEAGRIR